MSFNYSTIPLLVDEKVRTVAVRFFSDHCSDGIVKGKNYTYLTTFNFEKGDLAVVFVGKTPKVVEVQEMDVPTDDRIDYKWIADQVDLSAYRENLEKSMAVAKQVKLLEQQSQRRQPLEALAASDEIKQLTFS